MSVTAICDECIQDKPVNDFHRKSASGPYAAWNLRRCKDCSRVINREARAKQKALRPLPPIIGEDEAKCNRCRQIKPLYEFEKELDEKELAVWNVRRCKVCAEKARKARRAVPDSTEEQLARARNWKRKNPEVHSRLAREYRKRHPEKITAQNKLNYAIRKGRVIRQLCEKCGATEKVHAHHVSYEPKDWYSVNWYCEVCHKTEHTRH